MPWDSESGLGLTSIPLIQTQDNKPYSTSWLTILTFGGYSAVMMVLVIVTAAQFGSRLNFGGVPQLTFLWIIYTLTFSFLSLVLQIPTQETGDMYYENFISQSVPGLMMMAYFSIYLISLYLLDGDFVFISILDSPLTIIVAVEAMILGVLFVLLTRPVRPEIPSQIDETVRFLEHYFSMWWKMMRLLVAIILSISIGVAITIFISNEGDTLTLAPLVAHLMVSLIPATLIIAYMVMKSRVVLKMMSKEMG